MLVPDRKKCIMEREKCVCQNKKKLRTISGLVSPDKKFAQKL